MRAGQREFFESVSALGDYWTSPSAVRVLQPARHFSSAISSIPDHLEVIANEVRKVAGQASDYQSRLARLETELANAESFIARSVDVFTHLSFNPEETVQRFEHQQQVIVGLRREIVLINQQWLDLCAGLNASVSAVVGVIGAASRQSLTTADLGLNYPPGFAAVLGRFFSSGQLDADLTDPDGSLSPEKIAQIWSDMTEADRKALMSFAPELLGNMDGIPFDVRYEANRLALTNMLVAEDDPNGAIHRRFQQFLLPDGGVDASRQILLFDPRGDGRVAEVFGDLTAATSVSILVPGMGSTLNNFTSGVASDAKKLWNNDATLATIAWTGYDAPAGFEKGRQAIEVASDEQAKAGAKLLHRCVDGLKVYSDAKITAIGHSYGSLTVGEALKDGMQVDTVAFIGSPGVGVDRISEFPPGAATRFFSAEVHGDPVAELERFGDSPVDPDFGAFVFDVGTGDALNPIKRHSEYFDDGIAIDNLRLIVRGGQPTEDTPYAVEYVLEPLEDLNEGANGVVDWAQKAVDIPLLDQPIDFLIDADQAAGKVMFRAVSVVVEEAGTYAQDAGEWALDTAEDAGEWAWDKADDVADAVTFWDND